MQSGTQKLVFFTIGPMVTTTTMVAASPTMVAHVCVYPRNVTVKDSDYTIILIIYISDWVALSSYHCTSCNCDAADSKPLTVATSSAQASLSLRCRASSPSRDSPAPQRSSPPY